MVSSYKYLVLLIFALPLSGCQTFDDNNETNSELLNSEPAVVEQDSDLAKYEPEDGKVLMFIGQDNTGVAGYLAASAPALPRTAGITSYIAMVDNSNNASANVPSGKTIAGLWNETNYGAGSVCLKCYLDDNINFDWSDTIVHLSIWMVGYTDQIGSGQSDAVIRELAGFMNSHPNIPFFLRPGYEFDYQYMAANISAASYRSAYRRIIDLLNEEGVTNYTSIFSSAYIGGNGVETAATYDNWVDYYPGNDYVDWIGYSLFDNYVPEANDLDNIDALGFARAVNKPMMLAEATPAGNTITTANGSLVWSNYFEKMFQHAENFPNDIKAIA